MARRLAHFALFPIALVSFALGVGAPGVAYADEPTEAPAPPPDPRARFTGTFRFAGDAREEASRRVAIDKAIDSLFFAIRPIARSRLSNGTKVSATYAFAFEPGKIRVRAPGTPDVVSADNGSWTEYVHDGDKSKVSQRLVGSRLTQVFQADEGGRTNEFTLSPDGATLTLKVIISSPKLSVPMTYVLTYKRS